MDNNKNNELRENLNEFIQWYKLKCQKTLWFIKAVNPYDNNNLNLTLLNCWKHLIKGYGFGSIKYQSIMSIFPYKLTFIKNHKGDYDKNLLNFLKGN